MFILEFQTRDTDQCGLDPGESSVHTTTMNHGKIGPRSIQIDVFNEDYITYIMSLSETIIMNLRSLK